MYPHHNLEHQDQCAQEECEYDDIRRVIERLDSAGKDRCEEGRKNGSDFVDDGAGLAPHGLYRGRGVL